MKRLFLLFIGMLIAATAVADGGRYLEKDAFLGAAFTKSQPEKDTLWVNDELRTSIEAVLGHRFALMRVHYWHDGVSTAWILEEKGKEEPIMIGVSIENGTIGMVRVLEFRESRGWEVRYPFFTDQFSGARLKRDRSIDKHIDGITGATLSVAAVSRVVQLALFLHAETGVRGSYEEIRSASTS